jgi:hypothetical protein
VRDEPPGREAVRRCRVRGRRRPRLRATLAAAALSAAVLGQAISAYAAVGDGGSGSYGAVGSSFAFDLSNSGSTTWDSFELTAPAGAAFLGGATAGEISASCTLLPDGSSSISCPLTVAPGTRVLFIATLTSASACGQPFELGVSSNGAAADAPVAQVGLAGACGAAPTPAVSCPATLARGDAAAAEASSRAAALLGGPWLGAGGNASRAAVALAALRGGAGGGAALRDALGTLARAVAQGRATLAAAAQLELKLNRSEERANAAAATAAAALASCQSAAAPPAPAAAGSGTSACAVAPLAAAARSVRELGLAARAESFRLLLASELPLLRARVAPSAFQALQSLLDGLEAALGSGASRAAELTALALNVSRTSSGGGGPAGCS